MAGIPNPVCQFFSLRRGNAVHLGGISIGVARLPSDPIGNFTIELDNVVVGSRIHVEKLSDRTTFYDQVATTSTVIIPLSAYSNGNENNNLRIKVRNASGTPTYKPWETQATAIVGAQSIYVSQILDE